MDRMNIKPGCKCAVIVAHPDDETLWVGGLILMHPDADWTVVTVCRKSDPDRAPKFYRAVEKLKAAGFMADLDDGPEQVPLNQKELRQTVMELLPSGKFDLIITHSTTGEYTRHLRHEETAKAVLDLCRSGRLLTSELWTFAYEDNNRQHLPHAIEQADILINLAEEIWQCKYNIITEIYGFGQDSFEARTTPKKEAFRRIVTSS
jgi:LmbE family N-acetylglucosaminyl deacetylase